MTAIKGWARRYAANPAAVFGTIFGVYLVLRLVLVIGGQVFESWDSAVYAYREDPARNQGPLVSFVGDAPRPWGLPLFYALFGSDEARAVGQWALATAAWAFFAWELTRHLRTRAGQYVAAAGTLLLACTTNVANWDFAILTESLSLSLGVLLFALLLRWRRTERWWWLTAAIAVGIWWSFLRPDTRLFIVVVMVLLLGLAARRWWTSRRWERSMAGTLAAVAVLGLGIVWYDAITPGMERAMVPYDDDAIQGAPLTQAEQRYVYRLRVDASYKPELWHFFTVERGMPTCPEVDAFLGQADWQGGKWAEAYTRCPEMVAWVAERKNQFAPFWQELFLHDPWLATREFLTQTSLNLGGEIYAQVPQAVPGPIEKLIFPSRRFGLPLALAGFALAAGLAWWAGARRTRLFRFATVVFVTAIGSAAATVIMHTGEVMRYGVQEAYATRVAMVVMLACAVDAWWSRRIARQAELDYAPSSPLLSGSKPASRNVEV